MLEQLRTHLQQELRIPEILGDRCVHAHIETASCQACVEQCPQHAWHLNDDSLSINIEACDGCGLCAPACPQGAILHSHEPLLGQSHPQFLTAFTACDRSGLTSGQGIIPCVHALGLHDILKLYRQGIRELVIAVGECSSCSRTSSASLQTVVNTLNGIFEQQGETRIRLRQLPTTTWQQESQTLKPPQTSETQLSRRHFLRRGLQNALQESLKLKGLLQSDRESFPPPGTLLPPTQLPQTLPYIPHIDPTRCNGCDTCFKICPHEVLLWDTEQNSYVLVAQRCTGCRICMDACTSQAIHISQWVKPTLTKIPLTDARCRYCGVAYHHPTQYTPSTQTCRICSQVNHYRHLFQVLD